MPQARQLSFLPKVRIDHGGDIGQGKRKIARPFDPKRPLHVVLRSTRARGHWSMLAKANKNRIEQLIRTTSMRQGVRIYRYANVGNHLHLVVAAKKRQNMQAFLRIISGRIACLVTGAKKSRALGRFWDKLAYSRVVSWGREFETVTDYVLKNLFEASGLGRHHKSDPLGQVIRTSLAKAGLGPPA